MSFWRENMFFMNFKNHIVKWYRTVLLPVFHIDNSGKRQKFRTEGNESYSEDPSKALETVNWNKAEIVTPGSPRPSSKSSQSINDNHGESDAEAILSRINQDRENKHMNDIEQAKKKAEEEARLAAIMNANKVDVDSFIAQGKNAAKQAQEKASADDKAAEEMRRAQEIIERLNREAAEDEAKKQAELDAAKAAAAEKFG